MAEPELPSPRRTAGSAPAEMAAISWDDELTRSVAAKFGERISQFATYLGQNFLVVEAGAILEVLDGLRGDWEFDSLVDLTVVDYPARPSRFELVYTLYSFARNERLRIKSSVALGERAPSVCEIFPASNWMEREIYDMFGVEFKGHPDLRRLLLPEEWEGFPLRKDGSILAMDNRWVKENLGIESGQ